MNTPTPFSGYHNPIASSFPDAVTVHTFLKTVVEPDAPFEIRVINTRPGGPANLRYRTYSGFFDRVEPAVNAVCRISGSDAAGVYVTLNPLSCYVLNWNDNVLTKSIASGGDTDVTGIRFLFLDFDPERPRFTCATAAENQAARRRANEVTHVLMNQFGFPLPAWAGSSGSGTVALWRVNLAAEESVLLRRALEALSACYSDSEVKIDTGVHNPSRLVRVAGTINAKSPTPQPDRPWRYATGRAFDTQIVTREQLESVAALTSSIQHCGQGPSVNQGSHYDLDRVLQQAGIEYRRKDRGYATVYELVSCLTSEAHDSGAAILEFPSGAVAYQCHHDSCSGKGWREVKSKLGLTENRSFPDGSHKSSGNRERSGKAGTFQPIRVVNGRVAS